MRPCWFGSASGSHEFAASKEIEDRDELEDEKILLSGSADFLSWQRLGVGGKDSYLVSLATACPSVLLLMISVNKMIKE